MILPIITALTRDALKTIPDVVREAAYGIGATPYEVITRVLLPTIKNAATGAGILGLGRALGEGEGDGETDLVHPVDRLVLRRFGTIVSILRDTNSESEIWSEWLG